MLYSLIASSAEGDIILGWIEIAALAIEILAVTIIVVSIGVLTAQFLYRGIIRAPKRDNWRRYKVGMGRSLLLGLEILVAADVVRTVALEATLESVVVLGFLVFIRTFLSWSLIVEIEGRWPWQREEAEA